MGSVAAKAGFNNTDEAPIFRLRLTLVKEAADLKIAVDEESMMKITSKTGDC